MIVTQGYNKIASHLASIFTHGEVGSDNTTPTSTQTSLISPISGTLFALTQSTADNNVVTTIYELDVSVGNGSSIGEYAIEHFDGSSYYMISRYIFPKINKTSNLSLTIKTTFVIE